MDFNEVKEKLAKIIIIFLKVVIVFLTVMFIFLTIPLVMNTPLLQDWKYYISMAGALSIVLYVFSKLVIYCYENAEIRKRYDLRIHEEQTKIKNLLAYSAEYKGVEEVRRHFSMLENNGFLRASLEPFKDEWEKHKEKVKKLLEKKEHEHSLQNLRCEKDRLAKKIEDLAYRRRLLEEDNKLNNVQEKEKFLKEHKKSLSIKAEALSDDQKIWLSEEGFERAYQWDILSRKTVEFFIKPRCNEGFSHAYLTSALMEYIQKHIDPNVEIFETKKPDLIFNVNNQNWAIEIETGTLLSKNKKALQEKVETLNKEYDKNWFFVVANKNLVPKYRKFGAVVDRSKVIQLLEELNTPKKGVEDDI